MSARLALRAGRRRRAVRARGAARADAGRRGGRRASSPVSRRWPSPSSGSTPRRTATLRAHMAPAPAARLRRGAAARARLAGRAGAAGAPRAAAAGACCAAAGARPPGRRVRGARGDDGRHARDRVYDAALAHPALHVAEHVAYLGAAALFWRPVARRRPGARAARRDRPAALPHARLGAAVARRRRDGGEPTCPGTRAYAQRPGALADQHAAGELMWVGGGLAARGDHRALRAGRRCGASTSGGSSTSGGWRSWREAPRPPRGARARRRVRRPRRVVGGGRRPAAAAPGADAE